MLNKLRIHKIKTSEKELVFCKYIDLENCYFEDEKGKILNCILADTNFDKVRIFFEKTPPLRGSIIRVMISRGKNRAYGKRVIAKILSVEKPTQVDIEHLI